MILCYFGFFRMISAIAFAWAASFAFRSSGVRGTTLTFTFRPRLTFSVGVPGGGTGVFKTFNDLRNSTKASGV